MFQATQIHMKCHNLPPTIIAIFGCHLEFHFFFHSGAFLGAAYFFYKKGYFELDKCIYYSITAGMQPCNSGIFNCNLMSMGRKQGCTLTN